MARSLTKNIVSLTAVGLCCSLVWPSNARAQFGLGDVLGGGQLRQAVQQFSQAVEPRTLSPFLYQPAANRGGQSWTPAPPHRVCPPQPPQAAVPVQQPRVAPATAVSAPLPPEVERARRLVEQAKQMFVAGKFDQATPVLEELCTLAAEDTNAFQFRSFAHFANQNYDAAAADAYDALLLGNTWDWQTVYNLYRSVDRYQVQLRQLEAASKADASLSKHFLLGYQYLVLGHLARGQRELEKALQFDPEEQLVLQLVAVVKQLQEKE